MPTVTRRFTWDAAHRVLGHLGKCRHLHGHRYAAEVTISSEKLNGLGMIIDFAEVKETLGKWIEENWDHNILLHINDPLLREDIIGRTFLRKEIFAGREPYIFFTNPTAEKMAEMLFITAEELLVGFAIKNIRVFETPNCWADYPGGS